jgi:hypothetical protein
MLRWGICRGISSTNPLLWMQGKSFVEQNAIMGNKSGRLYCRSCFFGARRRTPPQKVVSSDLPVRRAHEKWSPRICQCVEPTKSGSVGFASTSSPGKVVPSDLPLRRAQEKWYRRICPPSSPGKLVPSDLPLPRAYERSIDAADTRNPLKKSCPLECSSLDF